MVTKEVLLWVENGEITLDRPIAIIARRGEEVAWRVRSTKRRGIKSVTIRFAKKSPFASKSFTVSAVGAVTSGWPKKEAKGGYKYSVTVKRSKGKDLMIDPRVIVEDPKPGP